MIQLNVDYSLLTKFFGISPSKIPQYANKDLEEIISWEMRKKNHANCFTLFSRIMYICRKIAKTLKISIKL